MLAVTIDATDGTIARRLKVKEVIPHFDGSKLDDLIDYLTFTFLPVAALIYLKLIPWSWWPLLGVILISSAYGFCQTAAKTEDSFVGFPSYWNLVVIHIYLLEPPLWGIVSILLFLSALTFVPIHFVYPTRNPMLMRTTLIGGAFYLIFILYSLFAPPGELRELSINISLLYPLYYSILSGIHHRQVQHRKSTST